MNLPVGTLINTLAVIAGSTVGLLLQSRFPPKIREISFQGIGLCTLLIGMQMAFQVQNILVLIFSILIGSALGEWWQLHDRFIQWGDTIKTRINIGNEKFTEGLITAFLLFCVGSLTIVGALEEGLNNDPSLIYTKSMLDGFSSMVLASAYGVGVLFAALPLLLFQSAITLSAGWLQPYLSELVIDQMSATGGVIILGLGINLLEIKALRITNMLPALIIVVLLTLAFGDRLSP
uniref:DUF554 domain-containing protein n=1 Tax=Roseihalotalea indica TaxID=2867963 RepID=A0AA49GJ82_9BACT|nr:DUF554 domain-containing protein [Tunicatimonas sp. TK19036]